MRRYYTIEAPEETPLNEQVQILRKLFALEIAKEIVKIEPLRNRTSWFGSGTSPYVKVKIYLEVERISKSQLATLSEFLKELQADDIKVSIYADNEN